MATSDQPATAAQPEFVLDDHGNLWRHYNDVGYVFLMVAPKEIEPARPTVDSLNEYVGPVRALVIPDASLTTT